MLPVVTPTATAADEYSAEVQQLLRQAEVLSPELLWVPAVLSGSGVNVLKAFYMFRSSAGGMLVFACLNVWITAVFWL